MDGEDTLRQIQDRLSRLSHRGAPADLIAELLPSTRAEAVTWARRTAGWDEYRGRYPGQAVAVARVVSRRAMRAFDLTLTEDGRVLDRHAEGLPFRPPEPTRVFPLDVGGEAVKVEYTAEYFPRSGQDHFYFVSPHEPSQPHPLSETGYLSHFALHDAVEACGGPEAYAALFAEARLRGAEKEFAATFEGAWPEVKKPRRRKSAGERGPPPVVGEHTAAVAQERQAEASVTRPPRQGELF